MINLIGAEGQQGEAVMPGLHAVLAHGQAYVHWYGKSEVRPGRKMGHVTLTAPSVDALQASVAALRAQSDLRVMAS